MTTRICFITAIYGNYETTCKQFATQTVPTDFICFTDNPHITDNHWIVDTTPYHLLNKNELDNDSFTNSFCNNKHTFNIAKYYKQSFQRIPILQKYDVIVWLDGTIEITYDKTSEYILQHIYDKKIIGWHHDKNKGILKDEVSASHSIGRYTTTFWNHQSQPFQDVDNQYAEYLADGYDESFFKHMQHPSPHFGIWVTCFVAFLNHDETVTHFLNLWYLQTLQYTTQDQISFPYVSQKTGLIPYTLPDHEISGDIPHHYTLFYNKHRHGN